MAKVRILYIVYLVIDVQFNNVVRINKLCKKDKHKGQTPSCTKEKSQDELQSRGSTFEQVILQGLVQAPRPNAGRKKQNNCAKIRFCKKNFLN